MRSNLPRKGLGMAVAVMATLCLSAGPAWAQQRGGGRGSGGNAGGGQGRAVGQAVSRPAPMGGGAPVQRFAAPPGRMGQGVAAPRFAPPQSVMQQRAVSPQGAISQQRGVSPQSGARIAPQQGWSTGPVRAVPGVRVAPAGPVVGRAVPRAVVPNHAVVVGGGGYGHAVVAGGYGHYPYYPYYSTPYYHFHPHFFFSFGLSVGYPVAFPYGAYYAPYAYAYPYPVYGYPSYGVSADAGAYYSTGSSTNTVAGGYPANPDYENSQYGGLSFDIMPDDAAVFIDGKYVGTAADFSPQEPPLALKLGKHHIDIRAQGFETMSFDTDVIAGQVTPYQGQMKVKNN